MSVIYSYGTELKRYSIITTCIFISSFLYLFAQANTYILSLLTYYGVTENAVALLNPFEGITTILAWASVHALILFTLPTVTSSILLFLYPDLTQKEKKLYTAIAFSMTFIFITAFFIGELIFTSLILNTLQSYYTFAPQLWSGQSIILFGISTGFVFASASLLVGILPILNRIGLVQKQTLLTFTPYIGVLSLIVGAILTPPDIVSQIIFGGFIFSCYILGVVLCRRTTQ